ncbi:MAG: peptide chain release factor N(5)-glutamine methyltransferase [Candidatus Binataceae bacterium]
MRAGADASAIPAALESATRRLEAAGIESARLDAQLMLADAAHVDRASLIAGHVPLSPEALDRFNAMVARRVRREPIAYILGRREFYSLEFEVNRDVLIPRPHTEPVVDAALAFIAKHPDAAVLEIGTGPGPIAIAIAVNAPQATVVAVDISAAALEVARCNAAMNRVSDRIKFVRADVFSPLDGSAELGRFDLIVSNPPYIVDSHISSLEPDVREFEPRIAIAGGPDGLDFFRRIAAGLRSHLRVGGIVVLEVGDGQDSAVKTILADAGMSPADVINDLDGIARVVTARL